MKTPTSHDLGSGLTPLVAKRVAILREQLPLSNLPDCLLAAYDGVSRRALRRFIARGSQVGNEVADWRTAENDLFLPVSVDLEDSGDTLYALATVGEMNGSPIAVAVEDRWLLISGHIDPPPNDDDPQSANAGWIDFEDLYHTLKTNEAAAGFVDALRAEDDPGLADRAESRPFCVIELPVEVDVSRCVAVLSDGLIAIRMPKSIAALPLPSLVKDDLP